MSSTSSPGRTARGLRAYARAFPVAFAAMGIGIWGTVAVVRAHLPWYATTLACWGIAIVELLLFQLGSAMLRSRNPIRNLPARSPGAHDEH
jgi:hypothetical protein